MRDREEGELLALIALAGAPGLSGRSRARLLRSTGSGVAAIARLRSSGPDELSRIAGPHSRASAERLEALARLRPRNAAPALGRARSLGLRVIGWGSPDYPGALDHLEDPPPVLFVEGGDFPESETSVAIVGTRRATPYGRRVAYRLARDLARRGWTVVSGMALGVDAAAHRGALDGGGRTVGVLGSGHARPYPRSNLDLFGRMARAGLLVSEFPPDEPPRRQNFPRRNRIIAALAAGVVVVEAGERSGALNTARHASDLGRDVMAVPHRAGDPAGAGALGLLISGAAPIASVRHLFDALGRVEPEERDLVLRSESDAAGSDRRSSATRQSDARLLRALGTDALTLDQVAARLTMEVERAAAGLARLEVEGRVERVRGGRYAVSPEEG